MAKALAVIKLIMTCKARFQIFISSVKCISDLSLKSGTFPEKMKIARVTPTVKSGDTSLMTN